MGKFMRKLVQFTATLASNAYFVGFAKEDIYKGSLKKICVPGLNCYSCPAAISCCPLGALQAVISDIRYTFSFYVTGLLILVGVTLGRYTCGWLCPFGLIQELLYKIPFKKVKLSNKFCKLKYLKYAILVIFVFLLPALWVNSMGLGSATFCKYICPAGTLEAGLPLVLLNDSLKSALGWLFIWKNLLLLLIIIAAVITFRPFCQFICPLGAIYGLFNPISIYQYRVNTLQCSKCGTCTTKCKLNIAVYNEPNSPECIRCGECITHCPSQAISKVFSLKGDTPLTIKYPPFS